MTPEMTQVAHVEGSPLPGKVFLIQELQDLLVQRLGAFMPEWHKDGCPGKLLSQNGTWEEGLFKVEISFTKI